MTVRSRAFLRPTWRTDPFLEGSRPRSRVGKVPVGERVAVCGFTLVEVLVALAVVAVTLAAGLRAAGALVDGSQRLADVTAAQWCAENQLAELRLTRQFPGVGDGDFACEMLGRTYAGTLRTRPTPNPNFRRVDAIVRDDAQRPLVTVSAVVTRL
jgi:general secretion pathway protein I